MRLDTYLQKNGYFDSRNKAQEAIAKKSVLVNGKIIEKPSYDVGGEAEITLLESAYVSRGAYKLKGFLEDSDLIVAGKDALDIGASTGGFTQILLEFGAKSVTAVDVGKDQFHTGLKQDARIELFESCDIRAFQSGKKFEITVCDVSFIGLANIIDDIDRLSTGKIILLFKPQFEVGKDVKRDKKGVVRDEAVVRMAMQNFEKTAMEKGWKMTHKLPSRLKGKDGNEEYFYAYEK